MHEISQKYFEIFKPKDQATELSYVEGVENCVTKNLYSVLFGETGIGTNNEQVQTHAEEIKENELIKNNIVIFGDLVQPRHLEIDPRRLQEERLR